MSQNILSSQNDITNDTINDIKNNITNDVTDNTTNDIINKNTNNITNNITDYDFQILLNEFDDLNNIPLLFKDEQIKNIMNSVVKSIISCIIGFPNSGKTFFLNQVQKYAYNRQINLPSGYHFSTKGISGLVNMIEDKSYNLWIDSEGMQKAVQMNKDKFQWQGEIEDEKTRFSYQQKVNEEFQKNDIFEKIQIQLLLRICNPIILVIDSLSELEEKYLFQLYQRYAEGHNQKYIIVIFNNKLVQNQEELNKKIEILQNKVPLKIQREGNCTFYHDKRFPKVHYYVLADQDSSFGQQINPFVYKMIAKKIENLYSFQNTLNTIKEYFNNNLRRYVNFFFKVENGEIVDYNNIYKISDNQESISLTYQLKSEIKPKILSISPLGQSQDVIQYMILTNQQDNYLIFQVKVFLPGDIDFIQIDVFKEKQTNHQYLSIKYKQKKDDIYQELLQQSQLFYQEQLQFDAQHEFDIQITQMDGIADLVKNQPTQNEKDLENGVYTFEVEFYPSEEYQFC
ncbi:hypothetical protein ABPG72_014541 [Tetrahymena utriculariae]